MRSAIPDHLVLGEAIAVALKPAPLQEAVRHLERLQPTTAQVLEGVQGDTDAGVPVIDLDEAPAFASFDLRLPVPGEIGCIGGPRADKPTRGLAQEGEEPFPETRHDLLAQLAFLRYLRVRPSLHACEHAGVICLTRPGRRQHL